MEDQPEIEGTTNHEDEGENHHEQQQDVPTEEIDKVVEVQEKLEGINIHNP